MKSRRQYLLVDTTKYRRHSAPDYLGTCFLPQTSRQNLLEREYWCRASVSDFSVLMENQSETGSSLELDTSNLSRDLSPVPTSKPSPIDSYQSLPTADLEIETNEDSVWSNLGPWAVWRNILLSQIIAGCLTVMDVSNGSMRQNPQNFITNGQNLPHYILLGVLWTSKLAFRNEGRDIIEVIKFSGLRYLFLSLLHVEANYLLLSSLHHNSYLGNQMIDFVAACLSFVIAFVCLEVQFHFLHISGFACTFVGAIGLCIANTVHKNENHEGAFLGDVLRIASGLCLAFNSVAEEIIVKSIDLVEYMGMIGLIGSIICGIQAIALEAHKIIPRSSTYWSDILSYTMAQFFLNSLTPKVLRDMGATGLHLALTSSGFYTYFIGVLSQRYKFQFLYLFSYGVAFLGSTIFTIKRTSMSTHYFFPVKVTISKGE